MEHVILLIIVLIAIVAFVVFIELKFPDSRIIKAFSRAFGALALLAAIIQVLPIDLADWLRPQNPPAVVVSGIVPNNSANPTTAQSPGFATPTPTLEVPASFFPRPAGAVLYQKSLRSEDDSPEWGVADDDMGRSDYDDRGYIVASPRGQRTHFVLNRQSEYTNFALEVDVTPLSADNVPAILLVVGWREDGPVYTFTQSPDGRCSRAVFAAGAWQQPDNAPRCPELRLGYAQRVRLEVKDRTLRAFIDGQPLKEYTLDGYSGGAIGLGVLNYAPLGSDSEAEARFNNLVVWELP